MFVVGCFLLFVGWSVGVDYWLLVLVGVSVCIVNGALLSLVVCCVLFLSVVVLYLTKHRALLFVRCSLLFVVVVGCWCLLIVVVVVGCDRVLRLCVVVAVLCCPLIVAGVAVSC